MSEEEVGPITLAIMRAKAFYSDLERYYNGSGIKLSFREFLLAMFIAALFSAALAIYLTQLFPNAETDPGTLAVVAFLAVVSLGVVIPLNIRDNRIRSIDDALPNALRHIAVILKAGGTVESAVEEVSHSDYGPLSEDLAKGLVQLQRGRPFEDVFMGVAKYSGSKLFVRTAIIINDAKRSGSGLADTMNAIADDARDVNRLKRERTSRTLMHVIFIYASALAISPMIFGFSLTVVSYIGQGIACAVPGSGTNGIAFLNTVLVVFLAVETLIANLAVGVIQEGRFSRFIVRTPVMILISIAVFEIGKRAGTLIIGGGASCS